MTTAIAVPGGARTVAAPASAGAARQSVSAGTFEIGIAASAAAFEAMAEDWAELELDAAPFSVFQSAAWARAVFAYEGARKETQFSPVIVSARKAGRLVAALALEAVTLPQGRALVPLGNGFAQYAGIVVAPGIDCSAVVSDMISAAAAMVCADVVLFRKLRADSPLAVALPRSAFAVGERGSAPAVDCAGSKDFESYYKSLKPKARKAMRNARNRLERDAPLQHTVAESAEARRGIVERALAGRAARLETQGLTSRAFADGGFAQFCAILAEGGDGFPEVMAMSLKHGDRVIAEQWGLVHQGCYYAYVASRDFELSEASPGRLHLKEIVATAFRRGLRRVDLMLPSMPYKLTWATEAVDVQDFAVPITLRGQIATRVIDGWLRPAAKRVVLGLPSSVRRRVARLAGFHRERKSATVASTGAHSRPA